MGLLDELKRLTKPYDDDELDFYGPEAGEDEEDIPAAPKAERAEWRNPFAFMDTKESSPKAERPAAAAAAPRKDSKVVNIETTTAMKVVLSKPERFGQVTEIADHLRQKHTVVLNLEAASRDDACRIIDFLSGFAYARDGQVKKVAINMFVITPDNVDIKGDIIDELENNGVYI